MFFKKPKQSKAQEMPPGLLIRPRPCLIDGNKAYFHRWVENSTIFNDSENKTHVVHRAFALIEYIDGSAEMVNPERLRFTDH